MTAIDKDRVLREIKGHRKPSDIKDLSKYLYDMEKDGFVKTRYTTEGDIVMLRMTREGERFLDSGGYSRIKTRQTRSSLAKALWRIAEAVAIAIVSGYCGWLLRGCSPEDNTASGRPEPSEHHSVTTSSVRVSLKSLLDLNVVSVASLAKSLTHISDNSASVLRKSPIRIPVIDMSEEHASKSSAVTESAFSGIL